MSKKKGKRETSEILRPYFITAIAAGCAMAVFMLVWLVVGDAIGRPVANRQQAESSSAEEELVVTPSASPTLMQPENIDGTGQAGVMVCTDDMLAVSKTAGTYSNETGSWYSPGDGYCYYSGWVEISGNSYHFDSNGYMSKGWQVLGGVGYYFDDNGVYDADRDASMMIALTFDDGPSVYTSELLDILAEYDVKATFMMLGECIEQHGEVVTRMIEEGHTIGNHSYDHSNLGEASVDDVISQFTATDNLLANYGTTSKVVRFPYGSYSSEKVAAVGKPQIYWSVDSRDWESRDAQSVIDTIYSELAPGSIVLMHDIYPSTIEAVKTLVPRLIEDGYELVDIETLAAAHGYTLTAGVTYFGFTESLINGGNVTDE